MNRCIRKRLCTGTPGALNDNLKHEILEFVGAEDRLYASSIDRNWLRAYDTFDDDNNSVTSCAAAMISISRLQIALDHGLDITRKLYYRHECCFAAGAVASIETILYARQHGLPWNSTITAGAAGAGRLSFLKWLVSMNCPIDVDAVDEASSRCHDDVSKYLWYQRENFEIREAFFSQYAARDNDLEMIQFIVEQDCSMKYAVLTAAEYGRVEILNWIWIHQGRSWCEAGPDAAQCNARVNFSLAETGCEHLNVLIWLHDHGMLPRNQITDPAIRVNFNLLTAINRGAADSVNWLISVHHEHMSAEHTEAAANIGNIEVMKVLIDNNCPVYDNIVENMLGERIPSLKMFQWLHAHNVGEWSIDAVNRYVDIVSVPRRLEFLEFINTIVY